MLAATEAKSADYERVRDRLAPLGAALVARRDSTTQDLARPGSRRVGGTGRASLEVRAWMQQYTSHCLMGQFGQGILLRVVESEHHGAC